jgi:protein-L-isoaspartate O-methyltransferase
MFIPVGPDGGDQDVWTVDKDESGNVKKTRLFGVRVSMRLISFRPTECGILSNVLW